MNSENDRNGEDQRANEVNEDNMIEDNNTVNQSLNDTEGGVNVSEHEARIEEVNGSSSTNTEYGSLSLTVPKKGSRISYRLNDDENLHKALVLGRAGKATGANKYWINIEREDKTLGSLNLENVTEMKELEQSVFFGVAHSNDLETRQAMAKELESWKDLGVYVEEEDVGQQCISTRWVITEKYKEGSRVVKARLVARGFEERNLNDIRKDSPTCGKDSLRLLLVIVASNEWTINSLDVKSAFLQGKDISRDLLILPPVEADTKKVWRLRKTVYGLTDASRTWYLKVREELLKTGVEVSMYDEAVFFWHDGDNLGGMLCCHVDDFFWGGNESFIKKVIKPLKDKFSISNEESISFKYLGLQFEQEEDSIVVHQQNYIGSMETICNNILGKGEERLSDSEKRQLRGAAGQLNWISSQTRPDIAYDSCIAAVSLREANVRDVHVVNKSIKKVKSDTVTLKFNNIGPLEHAKIVTYCDASFRNLKDENSQGGFIVFLLGENEKYSPIMWQSKKIKRVVKSMLDAECLALDVAADSSFYLRTLMCEILKINNKDALPIIINTDNNNLYESVYSTGTIEDKRLKLDVCCIRQKLANKEISKVNWISKDFQLADCFTKKEASRSLLHRVLQGEIPLCT